MLTSLALTPLCRDPPNFVKSTSVLKILGDPVLEQFENRRRIPTPIDGLHLKKIFRKTFRNKFLKVSAIYRFYVRWPTEKTKRRKRGHVPIFFHFVDEGTIRVRQYQLEQTSPRTSTSKWGVKIRPICQKRHFFKNFNEND